MQKLANSAHTIWTQQRPSLARIARFDQLAHRIARNTRIGVSVQAVKHTLDTDTVLGDRREVYQRTF